ncbi:cation transporter [Symmachiella dynata]|uniref:cation transporter n=1 Tax=Symmachiella dynata TaxID=2527995 RepID=UPI0030ED6186|tara:strand:- start:902 stop:1507 length:606 start_codon:yes stop_codon:yes gene_type:complete
MVDSGSETMEHNNAVERRALWWVLFLNAGLSALLTAGAFFASSSVLLANALDNASDAVVYTISLYAATRGDRWKVRAATFSGIMLLMVAIGVAADAIRRFVFGTEPVGGTIIVLAVVAMLINLWCMWILRPHRSEDVNLRATWIFSINDFMSNLGALVAGVLVIWLGRAWPDLVVGLLVAIVVGKGAIEILLDAKQAGQDT